MQIYPVLLLASISRLPETPRWFIFHQRRNDAKGALTDIYGEKDMKEKFDELIKAHEEESSHSIGYSDMLLSGGEQFHSTTVTVMGQVNQALTGYGAVSVYGPQIFELLGLGVTESEYLTQANYISYFFLMTFAWLLIDRVGRRILMVVGAFVIAGCFLLLTIFGGLAQNADKIGVPARPFAILGGIALFIATGSFGIGWLPEFWLIPTEIFPATSRAQGSAISVVIWGLANFAVTLLTPILFNNLKYWLFLVFAVTNTFAAWWTYVSFLFKPSMTGDAKLLFRYIRQRREAGALSRIKPSLRMLKNKRCGLYSKSTTEHIKTCHMVRKLGRMVRMSHYLEAPEPECMASTRLLLKSGLCPTPAALFAVYGRIFKG